MESNQLYNKLIKGDIAQITTKPYLYSIVEGEVDKHTYFRKFGRTVSGIAQNIRTDVWEGGSRLYQWPGSGMQMELQSSESYDDTTSGGLQSVELHYLNSNYQERSEIILLSGVTSVSTVATDIFRVQGLYAKTAGSGLLASGVISLRHIDDAPIYAVITSGMNTCQQAFWTVPSGCTAYIVSWSVSAGLTSGEPVQFYLEATVPTYSGALLTTGIFQLQSMAQVQNEIVTIPLLVPIVLPEKTDIKISAVIPSPLSANITTMAGFEGWYKWI